MTGSAGSSTAARRGGHLRIAESDRAPWERLDGETGPALEAFGQYLDLGPRRSIRKLAEQQNLDRRHLERWSSKYGWVERATAWDGHRVREERLDEAEAAARARRTHIAVATVMVAKAGERLRTIDPAKLSIREACLMFELGVKIDRLARGEATEIMDAPDMGLSGAHVLQVFRRDPRVADMIDELADRLAGIVDFGSPEGDDGDDDNG